MEFFNSLKLPPAALPDRQKQGIPGFESSCLYPATLQDATWNGPSWCKHCPRILEGGSKTSTATKPAVENDETVTVMNRNQAQ